MIKKIYISVLLLFVALTVNAQRSDNRIRISDLHTAETDATVTVSFTAEVRRHAAGKNEVYVFVPVLTDGNYKVSLPAVVVVGKRTRNSTETARYADVIYAVNGEYLGYAATVEAQSWMHGGQLTIESVTGQCSTIREYNDLVLSGNLHLYDPPAVREVITEVRHFRPRTVADSLSVMFPFVLPETMFDPEDPFKIYDEERKSSMIVYFHQGRYDMAENYQDNRQTLINLTASVEMILSDTESKVERVVVAGFASPEGSPETNDRLAFHRAVAVKHHLLQTTELQDEQVWLYNGSVDWKGLRLLVEQSNMPQKQQILNIIANTSVRDWRHEKLQQLEGGEPYRYMLEHFFPLLRNGAFIKVYYSNEQQ